MMKPEYQHGVRDEDGEEMFYRGVTFSNREDAVADGLRYWGESEEIVVCKRHVSEWEIVS